MPSKLPITHCYSSPTILLSILLGLLHHLFQLGCQPTLPEPIHLWPPLELCHSLLLVNHMISLHLKCFVTFKSSASSHHCYWRTPLPPSLYLFEQACKNYPNLWGLISSLYSQLLHTNTSSAPSYVTKWERDLGTTFGELTRITSSKPLSPPHRILWR